MGRFWLNGEAQGVHVAVYVATRGPVPEGKLVLTCPILTDCCNPEHVGLGTWTDVGDRMLWRKGLKRRTKKGPRPRKLTDEQVREIFLSDKGAKELADIYGVSQPLISRIRHRQKYTRVTRSMKTDVRGNSDDAESPKPNGMGSSSDEQDRGTAEPGAGTRTFGVGTERPTDDETVCRGATYRPS